MNELSKDPSPFIHFDEKSKKFLDGNDPKWREATCAKFPWVTVLLSNVTAKYSPRDIAENSDKNHTVMVLNSNYKDTLAVKRSEFNDSEVSKEEPTVLQDYPDNFSWR